MRASAIVANPSDEARHGDRTRHSGYANAPVSGGTCRSNSASPARRWQARNPGWTMNLPG